VVYSNTSMKCNLQYVNVRCDKQRIRRCTFFSRSRNGGIIIDLQVVTNKFKKVDTFGARQVLHLCIRRAR